MRSSMYSSRSDSFIVEATSATKIVGLAFTNGWPSADNMLCMQWAHFVSDREHIVQCLGIVQQQEGVNPVHTGGIGALRLAFGFIHINPPVGKRGPHLFLVILAERLYRLNNPVDDIIIFIGLVEINQRDTAVIQMVGFKSQGLLTDTQVAMDRLGSLAHCLNQALVNINRDIVAGKRSLKTGAVIPSLSHGPVALQDSIVNGGIGINIVLVHAEHGFGGQGRGRPDYDYASADMNTVPGVNRTESPAATWMVLKSISAVDRLV